MSFSSFNFVGGGFIMFIIISSKYSPLKFSKTENARTDTSVSRACKVDTKM
jgi:hypothetical protein